MPKITIEEEDAKRFAGAIRSILASRKAVGGMVEYAHLRDLLQKLDPAMATRAPRCDVCSRTDKHIHCPECGATDHVASDCDMED